MAAQKKPVAVVIRHETPTVEIDEERYTLLARYIPSVEVGFRVWISVNATQRGQVMQSWVTMSPGGLDDIDASEPLDPRSAVRIIKEVEGFETAALSHLSIPHTDGVFPSAKPPPPPAAADADSGGASASNDWTAMRKALPYQRIHDQHLLSALEDFIESSAFTRPVRAFALEHAHKFQPLTLDDEQPLHYQELYLQYEKVLEAALEAYLREHDSSVAQLIACVKRSQQRMEPLRCIDLLLAASEYPAFVELMLDYKFDMMSDMLATNGTPDSVTSQAANGLNVAARMEGAPEAKVHRTVDVSEARPMDTSTQR